MAQSKTQIQALLASAGTAPRRRFGQNFMIDQNLLRRVADAGEIARGDVVIEVGPGTGSLSEELLSRGARVIAVEIDRDLGKLLRERFAGNENFELIEGDALAGKHSLSAQLLARIAPSPSTLGEGWGEGLGSDASRSSRTLSPALSLGTGRGSKALKLVANLPYNIASPLVIELLLAGVDLLAFTAQKEVADRLRADESSDAYGPLSVMASLLSRIEVLRTLPPQAFWPAPKIESALVRMTRDDRLGADAREFSTFVHQLFSFRRKTLKRALAEAGFAQRGEMTLHALKIDAMLRPETLSPGMLHRLFGRLRGAA